VRGAIDTALESGEEYRADFRVDPPDCAVFVVELRTGDDG
jgi:hypothetical protein